MYFLCSGGDSVGSFLACCLEHWHWPPLSLPPVLPLPLRREIPAVTVAGAWSDFCTAPGNVTLRFEIFQWSPLSSELLPLFSGLSPLPPHPSVKLCDALLALCRGLSCLWAFAHAFPITLTCPHQSHLANTFAFFKFQIKCHFLRKGCLGSYWLVWLSLLYAPRESWMSITEIVTSHVIMYSVSQAL